MTVMEFLNKAQFDVCVPKFNKFLCVKKNKEALAEIRKLIEHIEFVKKYSNLFSKIQIRIADWWRIGVAIDNENFVRFYCPLKPVRRTLVVETVPVGKVEELLDELQEKKWDSMSPTAQLKFAANYYISYLKELEKHQQTWLDFLNSEIEEPDSD